MFVANRFRRTTLERQMSEPAEILELYCAECGYNLHGIQSSRCPECGHEFDRAAASTSPIPWMHRSEIGRVKAWWRTVWMATFNINALAGSVAALVPYADARRFWLINAALMLLPASTLLFLATGQLVQAGPPPSFANQTWAPGVLDMLVPWLMGIEVTFVRITAPILGVPLIMGVQTYWLGRCGPSRRMQDRAAAIGLYASGAWIGSAIVGLAIGIVVLGVLTAMTRDIGMCFGVGITAAVAAALLLPAITIWRLTRRLGRAGGFLSLFLAGLIPACWLFATALSAFIYPWCVGLVWLILRSI